MSTDEALKRALLEVSLDWAASAAADERTRLAASETAAQPSSAPRRREACRALKQIAAFDPLARTWRRG